MAKVDTILLNVDGKEYTYNINVGKSGIFKCQLDWAIGDKLGLVGNTITSARLDEVTSTIYTAYNAYLSATKKDSTHIWIQYKADGCFAYKSNGHALFGSTSTYNARTGISSPDALCYDFGVIIKELSSTGVTTWYEARKGRGCVNYDEGELCDPLTYYKYRTIHNIRGKVIPYSVEAYDTLSKARESIRGISEILFNFIDQEEEAITATLNAGKLLKLN